MHHMMGQQAAVERRSGGGKSAALLPWTELVAGRRSRIFQKLVQYACINVCASCVLGSYIDLLVTVPCAIR